MNAVRSVLVVGGPEVEKEAASRLPGVPVAATVRDLALAEYLVSLISPDAVIVDANLSAKGETFEQWAKRFRAANPRVTLMMAGNYSALSQVSSPSQSQPAVGVIARQTVAVWSPKGGVGKTFVATNLACAAASATEGQAALLDFDIYSGDVSVILDLLEGPTMTDLVPCLGEVRPDGLDKYTVKHGPSGLNVICSPRRPELSDLISPEHVRQIISLAEKRWGLIFLDTPPDITSDVLGECIELASRVVLVTTQDVSTLRQCKFAVDILRKLGIRDEALAVVLNRVSKDSLIPESRVREFLGMDIVGTVPDDRKSVERAMLEGKPCVLYQKTEIAQALWEIASKIAPGLVQRGTAAIRRKERRWILP